MYEVRCKVSDAKLASVLIALRGLTFGLPSVDVHVDNLGETPVTKTVTTYSRGPYKKSKRKPPLIAGSKDRKGEGAITIVRGLISKRKIGDKFMAREAVDACRSVGYSAGAYSHAIKLLKAEGSVRALGFGHYEILKNHGQTA